MRGLNLNVQNYSIASSEAAKLGNSNNLYMTPLTTKEAIDFLSSIPFFESEDAVNAALLPGGSLYGHQAGKLIMVNASTLPPEPIIYTAKPSILSIGPWTEKSGTATESYNQFNSSITFKNNDDSTVTLYYSLNGGQTYSSQSVTSGGQFVINTDYVNKNTTINVQCYAEAVGKNRSPSEWQQITCITTTSATVAPSIAFGNWADPGDGSAYYISAIFTNHDTETVKLFYYFDGQSAQFSYVKPGQSASRLSPAAQWGDLKTAYAYAEAPGRQVSGISNGTSPSM